MKKKTAITFTSLIMVSLLVFSLAGCGSKGEAGGKEPARIPVIVTTPSVQDITVYLESIGTLQPSVFMEIRPQTSGTLTEVLVHEGQFVKQGAPLFRIDPKPYEIKVREAEAQSAIDQAGLKAVQKKMARFQSLKEKDLVAQTEWDELKAQLKKAEGMIDLGNARLSFAKLELEHCQLNSPVAGRVGKLDANQGLLVSNTQTSPLATISKMDPLIVEFTVTEKEFPLLPKESIPLKIDSLNAQASEKSRHGTVNFVDNHFDAKTGLLLIRGKIRNKDMGLRPGQSVHVQIPIAKLSNAILVPQSAIRYNQKGPYVYVINEDQSVAIKQLVLGKEHGIDQIVLEGLEPAEQIILEGHLRLSPGLKVEIKS